MDNAITPRIGILVGSTRPGRKAPEVARWVLDVASTRGDGHYGIVDVADHALPLLDEPVPPSQGLYAREHTLQWSRRIARYDGYIIVTPEYNHGVPAALKNALDYLYREWNNKAVGFVGYGTAGGVRAVEQLRQVAGELQLADVRASVALHLATDFTTDGVFVPAEHQEPQLHAMLDQLVRWSRALAVLRGPARIVQGGGPLSQRGPAVPTL
jgi:NAD(P)H-dependent FMN reductase